jgi:hypothetical protein
MKFQPNQEKALKTAPSAIAKIAVFKAKRKRKPKNMLPTQGLILNCLLVASFFLLGIGLGLNFANHAQADISMDRISLALAQVMDSEKQSNPLADDVHRYNLDAYEPAWLVEEFSAYLHLLEIREAKGHIR